MNAIDLFAGPGGWDVGAWDIGVQPLGIEFDEVACETRDAAGHPTLQGDVAALDPLDFAPCDLLIASPPCQAWSMAGKRGGVDDIAKVYALTAAIAGHPTHLAKTDDRPDRKASGAGNRPRPLDAPAATVSSRADLSTWISEEPTEWEDERSRLVTEPLRWALALRPRYIALEQVPPVLDYWRHIAEILRAEGYGVWTGILEAERYGVPQTRERAILIAELDGHPHPPAPTHQRYIPGESQRHDITLEGEILPWVSMAEALGWATTESVRTGKNSMKHSRDPQDMVPFEVPVTRPATTVDTQGTWKHGEPESHVDPPHRWKVGFPRNADTPSNEAGDDVVELEGRRYRGRDFRDEDEPAFTVTEKARSAIKLRAGTNENDIARPADEPAPTIRYGERLNDVSWVEERNVGGHGYLDTRQSHAQARPTDCPSPAMVGQNLAKGAAVWTDEPALEPTEGTGYKPSTGVRVTEIEAAVLQGFPPDYPWQGSRTKRFQQIGNAIPPPLARAILEALLDA
jgi:DNA (cytosine-5)-methyltransferase 1